MPTSRHLNVKRARSTTPLSTFVQKCAHLLQRGARRLRRSIRVIPAVKNKSTSFSLRVTRPRFDVTYIPVEIWLQILREATAMVPDPLDTTLELSFMDTINTRASLLSAYHANMRIKTNFALVNKRFTAFVRPFLYEFVLISCAAQAKALAQTILIERIRGVHHSSAAYIRRLHLETRTLERCAPTDLRTILDNASKLIVYTDRYSVRCSMHETTDPRCSPSRICSLLAQSHRDLRRLTWTNYEGVPIHHHMSCLLKNPVNRLEYLELASTSPDYPVFASAAHSEHVLSLPCLRSLKVAVDDVTFAILAAWDLPLLTNVSVVSCELNYSGFGFSKFFHAHGEHLRQLELGHSSSLVEHTLARDPYTLAHWCPNLREFICSADAEWHWQTPDWIPPHVLLPSHPNIEFIGIRDIDVRLNEVEDPFPLLEQLSSLHREAFPSLHFIRDMSAKSHTMRTRRPTPRLVSFWTKLLKRCQDDGVWLEDYEGVNLTMKALKRASLTI